jgi:hypothetical protein
LPVASVITGQVRSIIAVVAGVAATAFFASAAAQTEEEPVHLEYHAPSICDDDAQFFARARSRASRMRRARPDERARKFTVDIEQRGGRMWGRLVVRNPEGRQTVREIEAKDCNEAVDALSLVVALAINPRAGAQTGTSVGPELDPTLPGPASNAPNAPQPPSPAGTTGPPGSAAPSTAPAPAATSPTMAAPAPDASSSASGPFAAAGAPLWAFRGGLSAWGLGAIAPQPLLGARASAEVLNLAERAIAPSFRASLGYAAQQGFVVDGGTAHFAYAGTNIEICPLRIPPGGALVLRPCVMADLGLVFVRGSDAQNARGETRPWADIGAGGRLEWALGRQLGIELDAGCMFPIWRDRFLFGTRSFHRVAWAGGIVALGLVMRIP